MSQKPNSITIVRYEKSLNINNYFKYYINIAKRISNKLSINTCSARISNINFKLKNLILFFIIKLQ